MAHHHYENHQPHSPCSVEDVKAGLSYLYDNNVASPEQTVLTGTSAGAVPAAVIANEWPEVERVVACLCVGRVSVFFLVVVCVLVLARTKGQRNIVGFASHEPARAWRRLWPRWERSTRSTP